MLYRWKHELLELLLQIANKIQNGALDCEEKLTLAKNTLQADVSHLESGEPVRYEQDVGIYLQECEGLIRQLQVDAQILRDETYYQVEQLVLRLELLLQIANKIQNGALDCEEKLTLAKNTLQADVSHLESGEPVRYEQDVGIYLQECEGLIRQLQVDAQILRDETYYQVEQLVFRIVRLQDELVALKLESTSLYRKGHFTSSLSSSEQGGPRGPGLLTGEGRGLSAGAETLLGGALTWLRRPLTRGELVAVSSSEDEGNLRFVYELLAWVEETQIALERAEWGTDLPSVEKQLETQHAVHSTVEELQGSLQEARTHGETSSLRLHSLTSLHAFVSHATAELIWLNEKEEEELAYDWSEQNPNVTAKRDYFTDELVALKLESTSLYRKGHFTSSLSSSEQGGPRGPGLLTGEGRGLSAGAETLLGGALTWLRRPLTRGELVAVSSSEDEGNLRFVYELLAWVEETQIALERAEWGTDLPSVEKQLETQHAVHSTVEELQGSLQEARTHGETSSLRLHSLTSLHAFVSHATAELIWLNEKEEEELAYDWSEQNPNVTAKRDYFTELRAELDEKQEVMRLLQDTAEHLSLENHPAKQTVEAYSAALQTQWQWVQQLCCCVEQHIRDNTIYFQFFSDARDSESYLRSLQDSIKRKYTCERGSRLGRLEDLLQDSMDEKEQLIQYKSSVASLVGRAKTIVQLKPRNPDHTVATSIPIRAICDYRQIEDNSQRTKWKVISPTGNEAMVPSVCFSIPPPNQEGMDTVTRIEQQYQNVMTLWHQLHVNMKSVVSWNYLRKDLQNISSWTLDTVKTQSAQERQQALDHMTSHLSDFLEDSRESELFTLTERRSCEEEVRRSQEHCQGLLESMETEVKDDGLCRSYLSQLHDIRLHLEEAEQRLTRRIQAPPTAIARETEASQDSALRIAEQERMQLDLDRLHSDLGEVSQKCVSFFQQSPSSGSVPELRAELNLAVERMERVQSLSSVYLHRLKTVEVLVRSARAAESLVKKYESKLSEEEIAAFAAVFNSMVCALIDQGNSNGTTSICPAIIIHVSLTGTLRACTSCV
ncbi:UNVERIFIED_CONTAM: hypothetical protein FKN15_077398 [Acipenser sinensis]